MNLPISTKELVFQRLSAATLKQKESPLRKPKNNNKKKKNKKRRERELLEKNGKTDAVERVSSCKNKVGEVFVSKFLCVTSETGRRIFVTRHAKEGSCRGQWSVKTISTARKDACVLHAAMTPANGSFPWRWLVEKRSFANMTLVGTSNALRLT